MNVQPGTLYARSTWGSIDVSPKPGRVIRFGRNLPQHDPDVQLAVGPEDLKVSRHHGELAYRQHQWWLRNTGRQLLRLADGMFLHKSTEPVALLAGYTWLYVKGSAYRDHLVELFVTDDDRWRRPVAQPPGAETLPTELYGHLNDDARLVLTVLGERYLHYEPDQKPRTYRAAAELLSDIRPAGGWTEKKIARKATKVCDQVHQTGRFPYQVLWARDGTQPSDNTLLHNLLKGLVEEAVLVPPGLSLLDENAGR